MSYFVYLVECADGTYYIGKTQDLEKRIAAHNGHTRGGAKYTKGRRPVVLRYFEELESAGLALKREFELKKLTKPAKAKLFSPSV